MHENSVSAPVFGVVVQVRDLHGDLHVEAAKAVSTQPEPLKLALAGTTVRVRYKHGEGRGVRVAPGVVITAAGLLDAGSSALGKIVDEPSDEPFACVSSGVPDPAFRYALEELPGAPVLDTLTGCVCGVFTVEGAIAEIPMLPEHAVADRENHRWLDLLTDAQLAAAGRKHLGPRLRRYLGSVCALGSEHEYQRVARSAPDLKRIYLARKANPRADDKARKASTHDDETALPERIDADRLLTRYLDVQILADPGAGKTSLVRHFASKTADELLGGADPRAVPLPTTARALAGDVSLSDALADALPRVLTTDLPRQDLVDLVSKEPLPGVPWLVLVDGLDEVVDVPGRLRVVRHIAHHRSGTTYRFMLTSRNLSRQELMSFDHAGFPTYELELFSEQDLRTFTVKWLRNIGHRDPDAVAEDLLGRLADTKLWSLVRVPLIATMLCVLYGADPGRELPKDQTELYEEYVAWQLDKIAYAETRVRLVSWLAGHGPTAERAADNLIDHIPRLLEHIAFVQVSGQVPESAALLDVAVGWDGVPRPEMVSPDEWRSVVGEIVRASGLLIQHGDDFDFPHPTIREFLAARWLVRAASDPATAARGLLAPDWRRRGLSREVKVFVAAQLARAGADLSAPLRRLLRPWHRVREFPFIAELARHGVDLDLDPGVGDKAVRILVRMIESPSTRSGREWEDRATWLRHLDQDRLIEVLRTLAAKESAHEDRRFEALRYLIQVDLRASEPLLLPFLASTGIADQARRSIDTLLWERDQELCLRVFSHLARSNARDWLRLVAAKLVQQHEPAVGVKLLVELERDHTVSDRIREAATAAVEKHDPELGVIIRGEFMVTARHEDYRLAAMERLYDEAPEQARVQLTDAAQNEQLFPRPRFEAAVFLVRKFAHDPQILLDIADKGGLIPDEQMEAALLSRVRYPQRAAALFEKIAIGAALDGPLCQKAIGELLKLDKQAAVGLLKALVRDDKKPDASRLDALARLTGVLSGGSCLALYEQLVVASGLSDENKLVVAKRSLHLAVDVDAALRLLVKVASASSIVVDVRMQASASAARVDAEAGFLAYKSIATSTDVDGTIRVQAVVKARDSKRSWGRRLLESLASDTTLDANAKLMLARHLGSSDGQQLVWKVVRDERAKPAIRMEAAAQLKGFGSDQAMKAYLHLAEARGMSGNLRRQANGKARQLGWRPAEE
ncbi:NACHT domain-containing protein [Lentzea sp. NPDC054927]